MTEEVPTQDEQDYLVLLSEEDPYEPEFVAIDDEEYEYARR